MLAVHRPLMDHGAGRMQVECSSENGEKINPMMADQANSYDEIPYGDNFFPYTHPIHLATMGLIFGIEPPPLDRCRVLELGCAGGGNLLPMALELPDAQFVGIDLSPRQIAEGQAVIERLGLRNVDLRAM